MRACFIKFPAHASRSLYPADSPKAQHQFMGTALRACPLQTRLQGPAPSCSSAYLPSPRCRRSAVRTVCQASATAMATSDLVTLGEEYNKLMARQMQWDNPYEYHPERGGVWTVLTCDSLDGRTAWMNSNWQAESPWQLCGCHACTQQHRLQQGHVAGRGTRRLASFKLHAVACLPDPSMQEQQCVCASPLFSPRSTLASITSTLLCYLVVPCSPPGPPMQDLPTLAAFLCNQPHTLCMLCLSFRLLPLPFPP